MHHTNIFHISGTSASMHPFTPLLSHVKVSQMLNNNKYAPLISFNALLFHGNYEDDILNVALVFVLMNFFYEIAPSLVSGDSRCAV